MRFLPKFLCGFVFVAAANSACSQARQLGTWKMYLPYDHVTGVYDGGDRVYCVTPSSMFAYEKGTGVIQTYDKATGLSDVGVQTSAYDQSSKYLAIAYTDNNMDFIYNGTDIYNLPDLQQYSSTQAITIYSISFYDSNAYLSSSLGISIINLAKTEISETFTIGDTGGQANVYGVTIDGTNMYAATDLGVKYAPLSSPDIQDFNAWQYLTGAHNLPAKKVSFIQAYNGKVFAVVTGTGSDTLYQYNGITWNTVAYDTSGDTDMITSLSVTNGNLYLTAWGISPSSYGLEGKLDSSGVMTSHITIAHYRPDSWFDNGNIFYEGDLYNGFFVNNQGNAQSIIPEGPYTANVLSLSAKNGVLNVCPGGVTEVWSPEYNTDGFFIYQNGKWNNQSQYTTSILANYPNIVTTATIASRNKTYFGSFWGGLIEYDNNTGAMKGYNSSNSILEGNPGNEPYVDISALCADQYDNLWISNANTDSTLKVLQADGTTWNAFQFPNLGIPQALKQIYIDENNQIWAPSRGGGPNSTGGLLVWGFNESNNVITYNSSAPPKMLTTDPENGNLPSIGVWCVAEDHSGNIWAGTDAGIATFYCPGSVLQDSAEGGCNAEWIKITLNGVVGYLFSTESVRALAVDAANRIWVGTTNGLWLISNDGQTTYLNFNSTNSPMPNSQVTSLAIDNTTGEVFIGTLSGLVSYQGDAVDTCIDCKEALVYPNPVTPDYTGPIAIKGLVDNAYVKITDVTGTLIFQGTANGTQMIWNGQGYDGVRAKSGVYIVFSSDASGKSRKVAKILITN